MNKQQSQSVIVLAMGQRTQNVVSIPPTVQKPKKRPVVAYKSDAALDLWGVALRDLQAAGHKPNE